MKIERALKMKSHNVERYDGRKVLSSATVISNRSVGRHEHSEARQKCEQGFSPSMTKGECL